MIEPSEKSLSNPTLLKKFLESNVIKSAKKLKGKFPPISYKVDNIQRALIIKNIFQLTGQLKDLFLIITSNYIKQPKFRYFLAILLATQSSDLIVSISKDFAIKNKLKLIQYSLFPKNLRINLLSIKEIRNIEEYSKNIDVLKEYKREFRNIMLKIKKLVENE